MQRMTRACAFLLAAAALVAGAAASAHGGATAAPALKLVKRDPLQIQGLRFRAGERVRVTATSSTTSKSTRKVVRTTARGTFAAKLGTWDRCAAVVVRAVGALGDRARLVIQPPPPIDVPCWGL
jgi:hypothetical protein